MAERSPTDETKNAAGRRHGGGRGPRAATPQVPARLLSIKDAARTSGIAYTSLREILVDTKTVIVRFGARVYIERAELDRLIESHKERIG